MKVAIPQRRRRVLGVGDCLGSVRSSSADSQEKASVTEARMDMTDGPRGYRFGL
jgi:hypothetical protein